MEKIIVIISLLLFSCSGLESRTAGESDQGVENHKDHGWKDSANKNSIAGLQLNNGQKWKADEPTRKNVAALIKTVSDSTLLGWEKAPQLTTQLQADLDTLVKQCRMQGPDHDALHTWLKQVMQDVKGLKKETEKDDYEESYAELKMNLKSFYVFFE